MQIPDGFTFISEFRMVEVQTFSANNAAIAVLAAMVTLVSIPRKIQSALCNPQLYKLRKAVCLTKSTDATAQSHIAKTIYPIF